MKDMNRFGVVVMMCIGLLLATGCKDDAEDQRAIDDALIKEYIADNELDAESTSSGLHYVIDEPGNEERPDLESVVAMRYSGKLLNGQEFDSSGGDIVNFELDRLIPGWQEGIPLFGKGGEGILIIPSHLGYGSRGVGSIPPNSVLVFDIELVDFN